MRWENPRRGLVQPDDFIPIAEETGCIREIGRWVLREAVERTKRWQSEFWLSNDPIISVNVSVHELWDPDYVPFLDRLLEESGLDPSLLRIEVTESALVESGGEAVSRLRAVRNLGVRIAIDDFGTGYSSLRYLQDLPVDLLKIDRAFVAACGADEKAHAIVTAILAMARSLGLRVVAEGIEKAEQLDTIRGLGADEGQGFYFSVAVPAEQVADILRQEVRRARDAA